ncbi:sulfatase-like hydrolase/transferase [Kiritimatiella glycovorans]|uniref:Arylsulfatase n=1 Tax=Kiritimatiella glycovorans TaxID=1307763 RepID=A0A0G3EBS4_9BACT|nr:sulfatase-like hydrolase/transferase [Kiritimatiella glycovorans]AKJ63758.1 Arylsulfatase precursor [Kiritimatiella glycovorans]
MAHSRRTFITGAGGAAAWSAAGGGAAADRGASSPHLLLITADNISARELGCYGHPSHRTPHLDRLASEGVRFQTCWGSPSGMAARVELCTGRYPFRTGWYHEFMRPAAGERGYVVSQSNLTLARLLQHAGYDTFLAGQWLFPESPMQHGYRNRCVWAPGVRRLFGGEPSTVQGATPDAHLRGLPSWHRNPELRINGHRYAADEEHYGPDLFRSYLAHHTSRVASAPVFMHYAMTLGRRAELEPGGVVTWPPVPGTETEAGTLKDTVEHIDAGIGALMQNLVDSGLERDMIVVFTADNGSPFFGKGRIYGERGAAVPLIVWGPGRIPSLPPSPALVDHTDIFPTLAQLAGASIPGDYELDGKSFVPALRGEPGSIRTWIYAPWADRQLVRTRDWMLDGDDRLWRCRPDEGDGTCRRVSREMAPHAYLAAHRLRRIKTKLAVSSRHEASLQRWRRTTFQEDRRAARQVEAGRAAGWFIDGPGRLYATPEFLRIECRGPGVRLYSALREDLVPVSIRARIRCAADGEARWGWREAGDAGDAARTLAFPLRPDGIWRPYEAVLPHDAAPERIWLMPASGPGTIEIEWIAFYPRDDAGADPLQIWHFGSAISA